MDLSDAIDFFKGLTSIIVEKEFLEQVDRIHQSGLETIRIEALARRKKMSADITTIQKFDISIELIKYQYERIKPMLSPLGITAMNKFLSDLENRRKRLVYEKIYHM
ncbi:hypothetical protein Holit_00485 [Hollandina sp. SP2]